MKLFFHKLTHWEYWPFYVVYIPVYFLWGYYALRARSIFFFNAANPTIKNGGFIMESKKRIYDLIPQRYYPKTRFITAGTPIDAVLKTTAEANIAFPLIVKPDIGLRGSAVKKIHNEEELRRYNEKADFDYLVQDLIPYPNEIGVFYVRYPHEEQGRITGIVAKEFLVVTGDGVSTIAQLLKKDPRHEMQLEALRREYGQKLDKVLPNGEQANLVPYGNHIRGAKFIDCSHWITPKLTQVINEMCLQVDGFYFGRLDLMYQTLAQLEEGKNFAVVELNGAASEPTHIYDPKHSLFFGWRELLRHIRYMYQISAANHKLGHPYLPHKVGMQEYRLSRIHERKIVNF